MKRKIIKAFKYILLIGIAIMLFLVFFPATYNVPKFKERDGTRYWALSTGSRIGYTLVPAKGEKKPYPVIYLQGGPGGYISNRNIEMLRPLSEEGFDIYLYDQVGSGHSGRLGDIEEYTAERHKKDLEEIIKTIGAEKVILIGQSWGAILATLFIADSPGKVEKLIVTGPGPIQPVREELAGLSAPDSLGLKDPSYTNMQANEEVQSIRSSVMKKWALIFGNKLASDEEADDFQTYLNDRLNKAVVYDTSRALKAEGGGGFYSQVMTMNSFALLKDQRASLRNLPIPLLMMRGQYDNQKWGFANEYLELFPNHKLVIVQGAGHSISVEKPDEYIRTIKSFLDN